MRGARGGPWWIAAVTAVVGSLLAWMAGSLPGAAGGGVLAVVSGMVALVSNRLQEVAHGGDRTAEKRDTVLRDARGRPPKVASLTDLVALGVHPARPLQDAAGQGSRMPPFVPRDVSQQIESTVRQAPFVLVVGESTAGKSRAALEAVRATLPDYELLAPDPGDRSSWRTVLAESGKHPRSVIWLDDLERYFGLEGFTGRSLHRLALERRSVRVVATMRAQERLKYLSAGARDTDPDHRSAADVIDLACQIRLDRRWTPQEIDRARGVPADARLVEAVAASGRYGVAETLAAGPQLMAAWQDAWAPGAGHTRAAALVAAAVDVRRCGWRAPVPLRLLERLHGAYLDARGGPSLRPETWEAAVAWAGAPLYATSALLAPSETPDSVIAFDYLPDAVDALRPVPAVPASTWQALVVEATPTVKTDVGWEALRRGRRQTAREAFDGAWAGGQPAAAIGIALLLGQVWQLQAACAVLEQALSGVGAVASGPDLELDLRSSLCWWTGQSGRTAEAQRMAAEIYDRCRAEYGEPDERVALAMMRLARWTGHAGDTSRALRLATSAQEQAERLRPVRTAVVLDARFEVAVWTERTGALSRAVHQWSALERDARSYHEPDSFFVLDVCWNRAGALRRIGEADAALAAMRTVVEGRSALYGGDHPLTLHGRLQLSGWLGVAGRTVEAMTMAQRTTTDCLAALGPDDELTLSGRHQTALWTDAGGDRPRAAAEFAALLDDVRRVLGDGHPLTEDCRRHVEDPGWSDGPYLPNTW